jgi:uncharacterized oxidoreductase
MGAAKTVSATANTAAPAIASRPLTGDPPGCIAGAAVTVRSDALTRAVEAIFRAAGSGAHEAGRVAAQLVGANLSGHDSHGVGMVPRYIEVWRAGDLPLNRRPETVLASGPLRVLDAGGGLGQVAGDDAMQTAIAVAREHGVALVGLRDSHHLGRIGHWAEQGVAAGLVTLHFVNVVSAPMVAPHGGTDARLVTNPVAIGVPRRDAPPLVLDFATSRVAVGKVRVALNTGQPVAPGALLDAQGRPTTDPAALFAGGALLPFGEHKGAGLALMCEILGAALIGGPVQRGRPASRRIVNNMLTVAIDPAALGRGSDFDAAIDGLLAWGRWSPAADPAAGVVVAGEPEQAARRARADGIEVDAQTWRQLVATAGAVDISAGVFHAHAGLA